MDFVDVAKTTFAAREFTDEPVPDDVLYRIFDTARFAPNGGNRQGWKVVAVLEAVILTGLLGYLTRYYVGKKLVQLMDYVMLNVPLLGKIYGTVKQVNQAFASENKSSFKQVVMVEFPRKGLNSVGFVTAEQVKTDEGESIISIFVPTTPNPTTGFLLVLPESKVVKLDMSVADGIKFIVSLGAVPPENASGVQAAFKAESANMLSNG